MKAVSNKPGVFGVRHVWKKVLSNHVINSSLSPRQLNLLFLNFPHELEPILKIYLSLKPTKTLNHDFSPRIERHCTESGLIRPDKI
jgi:hypothetical protein